MKKAFPYFVIIAAAAASAALVWFFLGADESLESAPKKVEEPTKTSIAEVETKTKGSAETKVVAEDLKGKATSKKKRVVIDFSEDDGSGMHFLPDVELTEKDRQTLVSMQEALDDDNFNKVMQFAKEAMKSSEPAVRSKAVEALSWFGQRALPELTALMADSDSDVAEEARSAAESAVMGIDDSSMKFETALAYTQAFKGNEEGMAMFIGTFALAANDLMAESENNPEVCGRIIDAVSSLIALGGKCGKEATERYTEITGYDWAGEEEARKWAADPDNYTPPASPDDEPDDEPEVSAGENAPSESLDEPSAEPAADAPVDAPVEPSADSAVDSSEYAPEEDSTDNEADAESAEPEEADADV